MDDEAGGTVVRMSRDTRDGNEVALPKYLDYNKAFHAWFADIPSAPRRRATR
jgi:hypothetical protein